MNSSDSRSPDAPSGETPCASCGHSRAEHRDKNWTELPPGCSVARCKCIEYVVSSSAPSGEPDWGAWKRHLIVCADCTAGDLCAEGRGLLGSATPDDAPWLQSAPSGETLPEDDELRAITHAEDSRIPDGMTMYVHPDDGLSPMDLADGAESLDSRDLLREIIVATGVCRDVMDFEHGAFAEDNPYLHRLILALLARLREYSELARLQRDREEDEASIQRRITIAVQSEREWCAVRVEHYHNRDGESAATPIRARYSTASTPAGDQHG